MVVLSHEAIDDLRGNFSAPAAESCLPMLRSDRAMIHKSIGWLCYQIVMLWPGQAPSAECEWFSRILAIAGERADPGEG